MQRLSPETGLSGLHMGRVNPMTSHASRASTRSPWWFGPRINSSRNSMLAGPVFLDAIRRRNHALAMTNRAAEITGLQSDLTRLWHDEPNASAPASSDLLRLVGDNHRRNFDLWHTEDEAR